MKTNAYEYVSISLNKQINDLEKELNKSNHEYKLINIFVSDFLENYKNYNINSVIIHFYKNIGIIKKFLNKNYNLEKYQINLDNIHNLYKSLLNYFKSYENYYDYFNIDLLNNYYEILEKINKLNHLDNSKYIVLKIKIEINIKNITMFCKTLLINMQKK